MYRHYCIILIIQVKSPSKLVYTADSTPLCPGYGHMRPFLLLLFVVMVRNSQCKIPHDRLGKLLESMNRL